MEGLVALIVKPYVNHIHLRDHNLFRYQQHRNDVIVHPRLYIETQHTSNKQINRDQRNAIKITFPLLTSSCLFTHAYHRLPVYL